MLLVKFGFVSNQILPEVSDVIVEMSQFSNLLFRMYNKCTCLTQLVLLRSINKLLYIFVSTVSFNIILVLTFVQRGKLSRLSFDS